MIANKIFFPKHLIHQRPNPMHILIPNLHKDRARIGQQIPRHGQPVAQIGQVGMNAVAPGIAEGFDLLRLAGDVVGVAIFHVAAGGGPLEVGVEFDAVGRIEIDALHLAAQPFALGQGGHHLKAVAQDHAVAPVLVVLVELRLIDAFGYAVEVGEQIELLRLRLAGLLSAWRSRSSISTLGCTFS